MLRGFMNPLEQGWAALPPSYRLPAAVPTLAQAQAYCRRLAATHYENFSVATWLLPRAIRPHFHAIYAYCRIADDLADEVGSPEQSAALLDFWGAELDACYAGHARHPVFVALGETIHQCGIPRAPFADLLIAFRQDQTVVRYANQAELLNYCQFSANPVGRLVLFACGEASEENFSLSDATCTALQLANFWQDVRRDYGKGRIYLPQEDLGGFGVREETIARGEPTAEFRSLLRHEVGIARRLLAQGRPLSRRVRGRLAIDLELFTRGGEAILRAIEHQDYDVLSRRPELTPVDKALLIVKALLFR